MRSTFPEFQFLLTVGLGGDVPETAGITLDDVFVSTRIGEYGGKYDLVETVTDGSLVYAGVLNKLPQRLLTAVGTHHGLRSYVGIPPRLFPNLTDGLRF
jgi:hypothetical protein